MGKLYPIILPFAAVGIALAIGISIGLIFLGITDAISANATLVFGTLLTIAVMAVAVLLSMRVEKEYHEGTAERRLSD
ncbi:MAG TPA: hypothetical protein PKA95_17625 [Thermomicrobiales bacterium]|nr:hypothetical protein [Thermomicrobiales bacterium]